MRLLEDMRTDVIDKEVLDIVNKVESDAMTGTDESKVEQTSNDDVLITCDSLVKIFKTEDVEVMALQGLDMEIKKGELLSVIGKSGSGKSTLMNIIGGLEKPSAGKIIVGGKNLSEMTDKEMVAYRKKTVGFVWQKSGRNLLNYLTSMENIEFAMNFTGLKDKEKEEKKD